MVPIRFDSFRPLDVWRILKNMNSLGFQQCDDVSLHTIPRNMYMVIICLIYKRWIFRLQNILQLHKLCCMQYLVTMGSVVPNPDFIVLNIRIYAMTKVFKGGTSLDVINPDRRTWITNFEQATRLWLGRYLYSTQMRVLRDLPSKVMSPQTMSEHRHEAESHWDVFLAL